MSAISLSTDRNIRIAARRFYIIFLERKATALKARDLAAGPHASIETRAKKSFEALTSASKTMLVCALSDLRMQVIAIHGYLDGLGSQIEFCGTMIHQRYQVIFDDGSTLNLDDLIQESEGE